jgi:hypothetical protein
VLITLDEDITNSLFLPKGDLTILEFWSRNEIFMNTYLNISFEKAIPRMSK